MAHNHKVAGSSPAPATKLRSLSKDRVFNLVMEQDSVLRRLHRSQVKNASGILQGNLSDFDCNQSMKVAGPQNVGESCPRYQA